MMPTLLAEAVGYRYPQQDRFACRNISFHVERGECVALLGPNGAGKSTFLSLIGNLRPPSEGRLLICGLAPHQREARLNLGLTPQDSSFPNTVRVHEILEFVVSQYGAEIDRDMVSALNLESLWRAPMQSLSGGQRRRVGLACALVAKPRMIVLDEPATGLDLENRYSLYSHLKRLAAQDGRSVLFSSHHFDEIEQLADRVVVMGHGQILQQGTLDEIRSRFGHRRIRFRSNQVLDIPAPWEVRIENGVHEVLASDPEDFIRWMVNERLQFEALEVQTASLEEIFGQMMGGPR